MIYVHLERDAVVPIPRDQTTLRMHTNQVTLNVPVEDELNWKLDLAEYTAYKMDTGRTRRTGWKIAPGSNIWSCYTAFQV